jgi:DNA polymerase-3 subunit alpha
LREKGFAVIIAGMTDFVHLHVHSDFSLQDAAVSVTRLADRARELGMKHLALTDHGNMFGAMEFIAACLGDKDHPQEKPVKPIIGCEVYVAPGSRNEKKGTENENKYYHLILLALNREGYFNLIKLCSYAYTEGFYYRPRVDEELLTKYHGGIIALSACVAGEIPRLIQAGKLDEAEAKARHYRDLFGQDEKGNPNFYLEIQDHGITAEWLKGNLSQRQINEAIVGISGRTGIPLVATNDVHYLKQEDSVAHDILLCIGTAKLRSDERRKKYFKDQFYFKSGDEMAALFPEYPEAVANTVRIAERCNADVPRVQTGDLAGYLPEFEIPENFRSLPEITEQVLAVLGGRKRKEGALQAAALYTEDEALHAAYLWTLTMEGLKKRYPSLPPDVVKRAEYELGVIIRMGFTGYFLIVADFINWAKEQYIPVGRGRGSGAGSIVAYALRITNMDPLKYDLIFERFLNPDRISMPDFDVDFANEGRKDVIEYVTKKYGREQVGQIITFQTLGAKAVIKDVARVLGISIPESDMITKLIPSDPKITLEKAFQGEPQLGELEKDSKYTELFSLARKLEGLNRNSSIHAAGVVIGKTQLDNFVPLYRDSKTGGIATQYTMNYLEQCGLVKMDFLGIKTLDVIKHTEELIRLRGGEYSNFNMEAVSETGTPEAAAAFKMLGEGKSFEVFQFESEGMQNVLKQVKPGTIEDLIALNALYRPGPMDNIPQFIESKNGRREIEYPDPRLKDILQGTYGVIVYQEQVMQIARIIAGYTMGQADNLRKAMGKKIKEIIEKEKGPFIEGAVKQGHSREHAAEIYDKMAPFAGYGFNKSHSAAYAVIAYQTAYLKVNFPAEFMAANLTNEIHSADKDKLSVCIDEARKMGLVIDPPDINHSEKVFTVVEGRIVYGFLGIKGLGDGSAGEIIRCRRDGPYKDLIDFLNRVDIKGVGKKVIELLIVSGAFDRCYSAEGSAPGLSRETLQGNLERAVEYIQNIKDEKKFGQASLFGGTGEKEYPDFEFETFPVLSQADRLRAEKELIGFYFSGHPMDAYRELWQKIVKVDLGKPETLNPGTAILVGIIKTIKIIITSKGAKMAYASLADYNGEIELTIVPGAWEKCRDKIEADKAAILRGKIEYRKDKDHYSFIVDDCISPEDAEKTVKEEDAKSRKWDKYRNIWKYSAALDLRLLDLSRPAEAEAGSYTVIGLLKSIRTHNDKKGNEMAFGTLQDYQGEIDLVFFSRVWEGCKAIVAVDEVAAFKGNIDPAKDKNPAKPGFVVSSFQDVNKLVKAAAKVAEDAKAGEAAGHAAETLAPAAETAEAAGSPGGEKAASLMEETVPPRSEAGYREVHIRLKSNTAEKEESLYPLLICVRENPGPCSLLIHVPVMQGETVIRGASQIAAAVSQEAFSRCAAVAEVWLN